MREIKFRAKDIDSGLWVYGNYVKYNEDDGELIHCIVSQERCQVSAELVYTQVDPTTIGEFTGDCDKNGKEIYEGDILEVCWDNKSKVFGVVRYAKSRFFVDDDYLRDKIPDKAPLSGIIYDSHFKFEVIGNVFDNPELLKQ